MTECARRYSSLALLALVLCVPPLLSQGTPTASTTGAELTALYRRFIDGTVAHDTARYRDLLTADYVYVGDSGRVLRGRSARFQRDLQDPDHYDVFTVQRCEPQIYGDAAVGPCWYHQVIRTGTNKGTWDGVSLVTFVRGADHRWRIAATRPSDVGKTP